MLLTLLLDEGSAITFVVWLLRFPAAAVYIGVLFLLGRRALGLRITGFVLAFLLAWIAYLLRGEYWDHLFINPTARDTTYETVLYAFYFPFLVGLVSLTLFPKKLLKLVGLLNAAKAL